MNTDVLDGVFLIPELYTFQLFPFNQERSRLSQVKDQKASTLASAMIHGETFHLFHASCVLDLHNYVSFSADIFQGARLNVMDYCSLT